MRNPSLFYEFHVCDKTFNARGIGVAGTSVILIGFTPHVAWGVTALGADQAAFAMMRAGTAESLGAMTGGGGGHGTFPAPARAARGEGAVRPAGCAGHPP